MSVLVGDVRTSMRCLRLELPAAVWDDVNAKVERLAADAERLREALVDIDAEFDDTDLVHDRVAQIAHDALKASG